MGKIETDAEAVKRRQAKRVEDEAPLYDRLREEDVTSADRLDDRLDEGLPGD